MLRVAQALAVLYGVLALAFPRLRAGQFVSSALSGSGLGPGFFLFAVPLAVSLILGVAAGLLTLRRRPDVAERLRLIAFAATSPFIASGMVAPVDLAPAVAPNSWPRTRKRSPISSDSSVGNGPPATQFFSRRPRGRSLDRSEVAHAQQNRRRNCPAHCAGLRTEMNGDPVTAMTRPQDSQCAKKVTDFTMATPIGAPGQRRCSLL